MKRSWRGTCAQISGGYTAEPCPHALELVQTLRRRDDTLIGLVTGNTSMTAAIKLEMAGFAPDWFVIGAFGNESPRRDDLTRLARGRAEAHLGRVLNGAELIVIGDTPADIQAARAIGRGGGRCLHRLCLPRQTDRQRPGLPAGGSEHIFGFGAELSATKKVKQISSQESFLLPQRKMRAHRGHRGLLLL